MAPKRTSQRIKGINPTSLDTLLSSRRIAAMASKIRSFFSESAVLDEASLTSISSESLSDWSREVFEDDPPLDRITLSTSSWEPGQQLPPIAVAKPRGIPSVVHMKTVGTPLSDRKEQTETKSPQPPKSAQLSPTKLTSADRQALWLVWTTLQVNADYVQNLDEKGAVGKLMLQKLYKWHPQRLRECLQCPPDGRGGILAEMARHIFAIKMGHACHRILHELAHNNVVEVASDLVRGMQHFCVEALPATSPNHHRSTAPRDWSLLARAWTEAMEELHGDLWTDNVQKAWSRVMTLLLRSIYKVLWYNDAAELEHKLQEKKQKRRWTPPERGVIRTGEPQSMSELTAE